MGKFGDNVEKIHNQNSELHKSKSGRAVGETKVGNDGITRYWTEIKPGVFDWRKGQKSGVAAEMKMLDDADNAADIDAKKEAHVKTASKLQAVLKQKDVDTLRMYANKETNAPALRQAAYDELTERGEDVSDIDLTTGKMGKMAELFGSKDTDAEFNFPIPEDSLVPKKTWDKVKEIFPDGDIDYKNDKLIKNIFNSLSTKADRIAYDNFADEVKRSDEFYMTPMQELKDMNKQIHSFIIDKSPFMIISGGAGVGKSFNFKAVADVNQKRQFDPTTDAPGDGDYDYVEVGEVASDGQLIELLRKHNGKLILFDDADTGLFQKKCLNVLKKATNPSGVRYVGKEAGADAGTFEFTGQIAVLTNKGQNELTSDDDRLAVYSRALKRDIYFTKREQLEFMTPLVHKFNFDDTPRLENVQDDQEERNEILQLMIDNFERIDPIKMNSRFLRELIKEKRSEDNAAHSAKDNVAAAALFGDASDWKRKLTSKLVKGSSNKMSVKEALAVLQIPTKND